MLHFELGYLYYTQHDYEKAIPELEVKNNPQNALAYTYLGDIALHNNDDSAAESYLRKAISLQGDVRLAHFNLGCVYADQKRNQETLAAFLLAERLDPTEPDAHYRLAASVHGAGPEAKGKRGICQDQGPLCKDGGITDSESLRS